MAKHNKKLSHLLSRILRHQAVDLGLDIDESGWVSVECLLKLQKMSKFSLNDIELVVKNNDKQRFSLKRLEDNNSQTKILIRANQGHSVKKIKSNALLKRLSISDSVKVCIHGTSQDTWLKIKQSGYLSRMKRNHIHFTRTIPSWIDLEDISLDNRLLQNLLKSSKETVTGLRKGKRSEVLLFINVEKCLNHGISFYISDNDVILCPGDSKGRLSLDYLLLVHNRSHSSQKLRSS